jgi:hypothetical protein
MSKPLSKEFLLSRKKCCQNGCQNCPWKITKEQIKEYFNEIFNKESTISYQKLRSKVLDGYAYNISGGIFKMYTGSGGALEYLKAAQESGLPAYDAGNNITVEGITLNDLKVTEYGKEK